MSAEVFLKGVFCAVISLILAWNVFSRQDSEAGTGTAESGVQRYIPYVSGALLPLFLTVITILSISHYGALRTAPMIISLIFEVFLHISLYDVILLLLLPFLRRKISARACAMLWLVPNYLYLTQTSIMKAQKPLWILAIPENVVWGCFLLWIAGFFLVFVWKLAVHLLFRRRILKNAIPVTDRAILEILDGEAHRARYKNGKLKLVRSAAITTPLSIGLFRRSIRIVLPDQEFSEEEYHLIFRHELVHIGREDAWAKFFFVFCTAICWFNPFMWIASKKSADDLELSCDETVLQGVDEKGRVRYAELILKAAGDGRGFTTYLSAAASTLRYRLKAITETGKRHSGALTVALVFFGLSMSCGYVTLAYGEHQGKDTIFGGEDPSLFTLDQVQVEGGEYDPALDFIDVSALEEYLSGLSMLDITGQFSFSEDEKSMELRYTDGPKGFMLVQLYDSYVKILPLHGDSSVYYLPEPVDWETLDTIVPELPAARVELLDEGDSYGKIVHPVITKLVCVSDSGERVLKARDPKAEETGIYSSAPIGKTARISFSLSVVSEVEVEVRSWTYQESYSVKPAEEDGVWIISLPDYFAHYMIKATFRGRDGQAYVTEFWFQIGSTV